MKILLLFVFVIYLQISTAIAKTIEVCPSCEIQTLQDAAKIATFGDTILMRKGIYTTSNYIANLKGTADKWITITALPNEEVLFKGQSTAIQLSEPAYLRISNLSFEGQTANGVNIDDGGSYETPAHNIIIENCHWLSMNATGNNDMLKMSGVDNFLIRNCSFSNGSAGGSGIDLVGCHQGIIENCKFQNQGSNSIQNKGGTSQITIQKNLFINGGLRTLNIGGSTGLEFFRPLGVNYEAKEIFVYSNIFIGSQAPIAFVGAINCEVVNNTIYKPSKWAVRILQENASSNFEKCANNVFINNIVYIDNAAANPTINIGSNTKPETFTFSNNLWFNQDNLNWIGPNLPTQELNGMKNIDPKITLDPVKGLIIDKSSPVNGKGLNRNLPTEDYNGNKFNTPRSIGAIEVNPKLNNIESYSSKLKLSPNPANDFIKISNTDLQSNLGEIITRIQIYNINGDCVYESYILFNSEVTINIELFPKGIYYLIAGNYIQKFIKI